MPAALKMLKDVWKYASSAGAGGVVSGSSTGNIPQRLTALTTQVASLPARNPYDSNGYDSWGFYGWQPASSVGTGGTDPVAGVTLRNLQMGGYTTGAVGAGSAVNFNSAITNRGHSIVVAGSGAANDYAFVQGITPAAGNTRYTVPGIPNYPSAVYTQGQWVIEANVLPSSLALIEIFMGLSNTTSTVIGGGAGIYSTGVTFVASIDAANWLAYNTNNGTSTSTSVGVAASAAVVQTIRAVVSATGVICSVNGVAIASYTTNFPTVLTSLFPIFHCRTKDGSVKQVQVERLHDWVQ